MADTAYGVRLLDTDEPKPKSSAPYTVEVEPVITSSEGGMNFTDGSAEVQLPNIRLHLAAHTGIVIYDKKDGTVAYTKGRAGLMKAWRSLTMHAAANMDMTQADGVRILRDAKMKVYYTTV